MKKTAIIGATTKPERYAYIAAKRLTAAGHNIILLGKQAGESIGKPIITNKPVLEGIHTVTIYINPTHQPEWYDYILSLKPQRVIFNPGTENDFFEQKLEKNNIEVLEACTLVMLAVGEY